MPEIAVLEGRILTTSDIYKYNIDKASPFHCFNCNKPVQFRQSRNAENNYTEHFFHPNTIKDTHIECEKNTLERVRDNDTWHNKLSNFVVQESKEVIRKTDTIKHIVDAYDPLNDMGIEFQNSPISVEAIQSRDATTHLDWIFNIETQYIRKVQIGNRIICEIPHTNWEQAVKAVKNTVYLYTGCKEWILLDNREPYRIEIDAVRRNVWIGRPCSFQQVHDDTCLQNVLTEDGLQYFQSITKEVSIIPIMYARCKQSMILLDGIHRNYVKKHTFKSNEILAIKSVAGSGKTTTLLELAKLHPTKRILYLAFNRALIKDIGIKIHKQNIKNLFPSTFHSLALRAYVSVKNKEPELTELRPQTLDTIIPWFRGKPYTIRKYYTDLYRNFCGHPTYSTPTEFTTRTIGSEKPLLNSLWSKTLLNQLLTFDSLLKLCLMNKWFKGFIDSNYDMIMIDETQDFDIMMLRMILDDTTIPKLFVGDPMQSIYQWRGCINGFDYMPSNSLIIEFYSTFRIGDPACELIRSKFKNCWMISKSKNSTMLSKDTSLLRDIPYTYLFRTWKHLLETAKTTSRIWIDNYSKQVEKMRSLHTILLKFGGAISSEEFPDDLPMFLKSLSTEELDTLICTIENNLTTKEDALYKFYTVHSYKGLEDDTIRVANDINGDIDQNLYYVALTRGMNLIVEDTTQVEIILPTIKIKSKLTSSKNTNLTIKDIFTQLLDNKKV